MKQTAFSLRWYHFLLSWVACIFTTAVLHLILILAFGSADAAAAVVITGVLATLISSPFILLFCILVHHTLLKNPKSKSFIHRAVFIYHLVGSVLVLFGILVFAGKLNGEEFFALIGIMFSYFVVDSIYFHYFIRSKGNATVHVYNEDLLDDI